MRRSAARLGALLACLAATAAAQATMPADSVLRRAQRAVGEGNGAAGRALVDSVLAATPTGSPRFAEALFWRAALGESATRAEQDYVRLTTEHALSPWAGEALLRLGQLQYARGERTLALKYFARLVVEHAETPLAAPGFFWKARVLLEQNDVAPACDAFREAKARALPNAIELRNQIDYYAQRCAVDAAPNAAVSGAASGTSAPASAGSTATAATAATAAATTAAATTAPATTAPAATASAATVAPTAPAPRPAPAVSKTQDPGWSVQLGAFRSRSEAAKVARGLTQRGYAARVDGEVSPYRVRVGRYPTQAAAAGASARMKKKGLRGTVVRAGPP